jgi:NAD(P)-dependent dehydrogenase (short-subunit alcohol dehydrogenase family)
LDLKLTNKVAFVTGSTAGIGLAIAPALASEGAFVEAMAKQQNKSKQTVEKEFFEHVRPSSLLKRFATVNEIAAMVTYLSGESSSATNGAALRVDGGVVKAIL